MLLGHKNKAKKCLHRFISDKTMKKEELEQKIEDLQMKIKAMQANPSLTKNYRETVQQLFKLRRKQIRLGKNEQIRHSPE